MSMGDKIKHEAEEAKGRLKETVGDATDNPKLQAEGRGETLAAQAKQVGDEVKDAAQEVAEEGEEAVRRMKDR
ncbi:CsbD family protein [Antribacter sp. KLBMP9083]|uniref:CsbD family protein n=1 Tax=Antribacter soli TaxID=2910976 RepID=A0AA41QFV6_9MICO|nr:CsbD family protein [Antribacter soli]MCF4122348.1 CsbD family protein [Antribacter soli]